MTSVSCIPKSAKALKTNTDNRLSQSQTPDRRCITKLRKRFERWELTHLRELASTLHQQLEEATARAHEAEQALAFWHQHAQDLRGELMSERPGTAIGLTQDGALHVLQGGAA